MVCQTSNNLLTRNKVIRFDRMSVGFEKSYDRLAGHLKFFDFANLNISILTAIASSEVSSAMI